MACADAGEDRIIGRINMAIGTARTLVRNPEVRMVEDRAQPSGGHPGRVAGEAGGRIIRRDVIRHVCAISLSVREIRLMAAVAIRGWVAGRIVAADMAVRAGIDHRPDRAGNRGARRQHMWTLKRETCGTVVELSIAPQHRVVAARAHGRGEVRRHVIRYAPAKGRRALPRRFMAAVAIRVRRRQVVVVVDVAVRAGHHLPRR